MRKGDGQMASKDGFLPVEFSDLERFAPDWVFETEHTGNAFRVEQSMADLDDYYHTVFPRMDALCDYVDQFTRRHCTLGYSLT